MAATADTLRNMWEGLKDLPTPAKVVLGVAVVGGGYLLYRSRQNQTSSGSQLTTAATSNGQSGLPISSDQTTGVTPTNTPWWQSAPSWWNTTPGSSGSSTASGASSASAASWVSPSGATSGGPLPAGVPVSQATMQRGVPSSGFVNTGRRTVQPMPRIPLDQRASVPQVAARNVIVQSRIPATQRF